LHCTRVDGWKDTFAAHKVDLFQAQAPGWPKKNVNPVSQL